MCFWFFISSTKIPTVLQSGGYHRGKHSTVNILKWNCTRFWIHAETKVLSSRTQQLYVKKGKQSLWHLCWWDYILPYFIRVNSITNGKGQALIITGPSSLHGITWWFNLIFLYILPAWLFSHSNLQPCIWQVQWLKGGLNKSMAHGRNGCMRMNVTSEIGNEKLRWLGRLIKIYQFWHLSRFEQDRNLCDLLWYSHSIKCSKVLQNL